MSGFENTEDCPRCGPTRSLQLYGKFRICTHCNQFRVDYDRTVSKELIEDMTFAAPHRYNRSLVYVPGVAYPVSTIKPITQAVQNNLMKNFKARDSDVWICTYPKAGTTWMQNVVSHILYGESSSGNCDGVCIGLDEAENTWWLEAQCGEATGTERDMVKMANDLPESRRRCFKSHSPLGTVEPLLTAKGKVIHVARNPKDVAVSLWHQARTVRWGYDGPFEHWLEKMFMPGHVESGSWWDFVLPYCHASARSAAHPEPTSPFTKVHTIWYEKMMDNPVGSVMEIATFLEVPITSERAVEISEKCSFSAVKEAERLEGLRLFNPPLALSTAVAAISERQRIRRGGSGHWKEYFTVAQNDRFDQHHIAKCALPTYRGLNLDIHWGK